MAITPIIFRRMRVAAYNYARLNSCLKLICYMKKILLSFYMCLSKDGRRERKGRNCWVAKLTTYRAKSQNPGRITPSPDAKTEIFPHEKAV